MSLRKLTLLLILATTAGLMVVVLVNNTRILQSHFAQQEKNDVYQNIQQVKNAIDEQIQFMVKISNDWANWDDTYQFVQDGNSEYIQSNLMVSTFTDLNINLLVMVNERLEIVYSGMVDPNGQYVTVPPAEILAHLQPGGLFPVNASDLGTRHGLILIGNQPLMIISHPINRTNGIGPARGTLLLGKFLDQTVIESINKLLSVSVDLFPIGMAQKDAKLAAVLAYQATLKDPYYVDLSAELVDGYLVLSDIFHQPILILRLGHFPSIYSSGLLVNEYLIISEVMISITFGILLFLLIEFNVLARVRQLNSAVLAIGASGDATRRLRETRKDELSTLASTINAMLVALEKANLQHRESEERFRILVESMEDIVFTVERPDSRIHIYDTQRAKNAAGQSVLQVLPETLQADLQLELNRQAGLLEQSFQGASVSLEWSSQVEGSPRSFFATLSPVYSAQNAIERVVGVSKDVTAYKQLEQDLRLRIHELRALFHISEQLLGEIEKVNIYELICRLAVTEMDVDAAWAAVPSPDGSILVPVASCGWVHVDLPEIQLFPANEQDLHPAASAYHRQKLVLFSSAAPTSGGEGGYDAMASPLLKGDSILAVLVMVKTTVPQIYPENLPTIQSFTNLASMAAQNVVLFKQILKGRERLQSLSQRMVEIQEQERREIALELHDEIGQILTGLHFSVEMIQSLPPEKIEGQVHSTVEIINDLIARVRKMSLSLRPSMLDDLGIVPTLVWYFERYTTQTGIHVDFQANNLPGQRFSPNLEITAFRVVQEALTNVARYAAVQSVNVRMWCTETLLGIQVEDEGVGFDQDLVLSSHDSKGLLGMRERVEFLGGTLNIITQPGEGTSLTAEIPLKGIIERRQRDSADRIGG